ncbi:ATP-binding cassette, subfamily B [Clostridium collagenovorans DSM 3089]|uniref:ATP-binding cassette, subfamily B n=1 Tax=Clostridium collagenovorans DSM 3089 TaxID=1121306 RepID=A0A1M5V993_9CLOT|nr:ABC transporter ATP-binding protein [Clostridium collagenovorans]SHH71795.1 ATP-binding cassette, subfamily B [Clostridium collagenovorans DSM 3089]
MKDDNRKVLNSLFKLMKPYSKSFVLFFFAILFQASISVLFPFIFSYLINEVYYNKNLSVLGSVIGIYLILFLIRSLLNLVESRIKANMLTDFLLDIRSKTFNSIIFLKPKYMNDINIGEEIMKLNKDMEHIFYFVYGIFYNITDAIKLILTLIIIYTMNKELFLIILFIVPCIVVLSHKLGGKISKENMKYRKECGKLSGWLFEIIQGIRDIRLMSAHKSVIDLYKEKLNKINNKEMKLNLNNAIIERIISFAELIGTLIVYVSSVIFISAGKLSIGGFVAIIDYFGNTQGLLGSLATSQVTLCKDFEYIKNLLNYMEQCLEKGEAFNSSNNTYISSSEIEFCNVDFGYDNRDKILDNINFKIKSGETIAITGKNGSGKSTLMNLLMRFYEADEGKITLGNVDIREIPLDYLRKYCGIVLQDHMVFDGSIKDNLQIGNENCSFEDLVELCKKVNLYDFICGLPAGMDTILGTEGIQLSGGQKQRLCIARVLLRNPEIIIFDEATSALDSETEKIIMETIECYKGKKTIIFITHSLSMVQIADRVLSMDSE